MVLGPGLGALISLDLLNRGAKLKAMVPTNPQPSHYFLKKLKVPKKISTKSELKA